MSILKDSESSKKIDCVINTVETASRLIVHAINILDLSVFRAASGRAVSLISYFCSNVLINLLCITEDKNDQFRDACSAKIRLLIHARAIEKQNNQTGYCKLRSNDLSSRIDNFKNEFLVSLNHSDNCMEL